MNYLRKTIIAFVVLAISATSYILYKNFSDAPVINITQQFGETEEVDIESKFNGQAAEEVGEAVVGETSRSEYKMYDDSNEVIRKFGFTKLLHRNKDLWEVEKPYMNIYEKSFTCTITSATGHIRVERVAGKIVPIEARLSKDVNIQINSESDDQAKSCDIFMDDLAYDGERSEFYTAGPVKILSPDAQLFGNGMTLIYNNALNRIELLRIAKLDSLNLKSNESDKLYRKDKTALTADESVAESGAVSPESEDQITSAAKVEENAALSEKASESLYNCTFTKNVIITTGENTVTADEVNISNIIWTGGSSDSENETLPEKEQAASDKSVAVDGEKTVENKAAVNDDGGEDDLQADITVTCDGSLILKPVDSIFDSNNQSVSKNKARVFEFYGKPVRVKQNASTLAECTHLKYDMDSDVLNLSSQDKSQHVRLNMDRQNGSLETTGQVVWDRKARFALIDGPGKVAMNDSADENFEMDFDGVMNLYFVSNADVESNDSLTLQMIDIAGGMKAKINSENQGELESKKAVIHFDGNSQVTSAKLDGDVSFKDDRGHLESSKAEITFAKNNDGKTYPAKVKAVGGAILKPVEMNENSAIFRAIRIDYDISRDYALAEGPVELEFYVPNQKDTGDELLPVVVNAEDNAEYFVADNRVVFNGDVVGRSSQSFEAYTQTNKFNGEKLVIDLAGSQNGVQGDAASLKKITLAGDGVRLVSERVSGEKLINKITLDSNEIVYDNLTGVVIAKGPGIIQVNNRAESKQNVDNGKDAGLSMQGPCYALIENFSLLRWDTKRNLINADSSDRLIHIGYVPILADGSTGKEKLVDTGKIEAKFKSTEDGRFELDSLIASDSVLYEEPGVHQFVGDKLVYETSSSTVTITGTEDNPCMINNNLADNIIYNVVTGDIKASMAGTSAVPVKPRIK